ncbi:MAG TPA: DUF1579 domain-containing protein [Allosphingosinicella sp.]|jgi:hypothetical protein
MAAFRALDGQWRGTAWVLTPGGRQTLVQTERAGPLLDGTVRVVEGAGYLENGTRVFHALGVISYDPQRRTYRIATTAQGQTGTFAIRPTSDGYVWETPGRPGETIRYTAHFQGPAWTEYGERIGADGTILRIFEMRLTRVGETGWPGEGQVPPQGSAPAADRP